MMSGQKGESAAISRTITTSASSRLQTTYDRELSLPEGVLLDAKTMLKR